LISDYEYEYELVQQKQGRKHLLLYSPASFKQSPFLQYTSDREQQATSNHYRSYLNPAQVILLLLLKITIKDGSSHGD
jgi:hypothetical protein